MNMKDPQLLEKEINIMYCAYKRVAEMLYKSDNPAGEINSAILDVIAKNPSDSRLSMTPDLAAFGTYLKLMLHSQKDGALQFPTEYTFKEWYCSKQ